MNVTLETERDRHFEKVLIDRIMAAAPSGASAVRLPQFSVVDYALTVADSLRMLIELKVRKETLAQVRSYGGLMLKHKKITELVDISDKLKAPCYVVFGFENGLGTVLAANVQALTDLPLESPPRRRNYRGLPTDEEPVCYLDWDTHLTQWAV